MAAANLPDLFTTAQLEMAVGGAQELKKLLDKDRDGVADAALIAAVKALASADVYSIVHPAVDPSDATVQGANLLQEYAVTVGVYWTWSKSTGGIAVPPEVEAAYQKALDALREVREGKRSIGTSTEPASSVVYGQVTLNGRWSRDDWKGFA